MPPSEVLIFFVLSDRHSNETRVSLLAVTMDFELLVAVWLSSISWRVQNLNSTN
jgi:hypothetical protein